MVYSIINNSRKPMQNNPFSYHSSQLKTASSARMYVQLVLTLASMLAVIGMDLHFNRLNRELEAELANQQARLALNQAMILELERVETLFYQMAITPKTHTQKLLREQAQACLDNIQSTLAVLEQGGSIDLMTRLSLAYQPEMQRTIHYQPPVSQGYLLERIELLPKLRQLQAEGEHLLGMLGEAGDNSGRAVPDLLQHRHSLPQLVIRTKENANRLMVVQHQRLEQLTLRVAEQQHYHLKLQLVLTASVVLLMMAVGFKILRQVQASNMTLRQMARELEFQKFALDQHAIVSSTDLQGNIIYANDRFCGISGYKREELLGQNHRLIKSDEHPTHFYKRMWDTITAGQVWTGEVKNRTKYGEDYWVDATIVPLNDEQGKPFQFISIRTNVTERKLMEQTIQENNRFLTRLTDTMGEGVYVLDKNGLCVFINPKALELLGYEKEQILGSNIHNFIHHHDQNNRELNEADCPILNTIKKMQNYSSDDELFFRRDGRSFPVSINAVPIYEDDEFYGHVAVFQDISQRRETETRIQVAKDAAEQANLAKSQFLANMSHEIRTPMNAIIGMSHLALQTELTSKQHNYIDKIYRAANSLLRLINDILDLSKVEAGKVELELSRFSLPSLLDDLAGVLAMPAEQKGLELLFEVDPRVPIQLTGDAMRLNQVLLNLCNNALKFTDLGEIIVSVGVLYQTPDTIALHFKVQDSGVGMTQQQKERLFQPFTQADASTTRRFGGTGLGLSISKKLVDLMQGTIWADSEPDQGSVFHFTANFAMDGSEVSGSVQIAGLADTDALLVEPREQTSRVLSSVLATQAMRVQCCDSVEQAKAHLLERRPALMLVDWRLGAPVLELLTQIAELPEGEQPLVVVLLPYGNEDAVSSITEIGLETCMVLSLPVTPSSLLNAIATAMDQELHTGTAGLPKVQGFRDAVAKLAGAKVLLVEDNAFNQEVAYELLQNNGIQVCLANNGQQALESVQQQAFDGVLMDCQMPVMDGYEATRQLRAQEAFSKLPILAMTANVMREDIQRMLDAGMDDHIAKPIDIHLLFTTMAKWITPASPSQPDKPAECSEPPVAKRLDELVTLNTQQAIKRLGGNRSAYIKVLNKFADSQRESVNQAERALQQSERDTALRELHSLKGTAGSIGADKLQSLAIAAETELRNCDAEQLPLARQLQAELTAVLDDIAGLIADEDEAPQPVAGESVSQLLTELKARLREYDGEAEAIMLRLKQSLPAGKTLEKLDAVATAIANYDYESALSRLERLEVEEER